ncbi:MAG: thioredoxin domain-containing protein, partial [Eubacteriales bacterium]|nr:thioredoxin domain-containing protein [Eubacteriales bacterium]
MQNHLNYQTSPYLLQHANNPVEWYPWCKEAFARAKQENKPIFLSIGYSTCHWCHVMAHESFEDVSVAEILNRYFISIKVDKEERPDLDSIYMAVCQAFTGSGGWPTTIFMTPEQKPFFAGTYFPKNSRYGQIGLKELLVAIHEKWTTDQTALLKS